MSTLAGLDLDALSAALRQRGLDGWLVYDFHGVNPIARRFLGGTGMLTRRLLIWLPAVGPVKLLVHGIDRPAVGEFPGEVEVFTTWQDLHQLLATLARGRRIAMETFSENAVPYLDLVPHGIVELLTRFGAGIVTSAPLITQFAARWTARELDEHREVAEAIAAIARGTLARVVRQVGSADEYDVQQQVIAELRLLGYDFDDPPIVAFGAHAADPHYSPEPSSSTRLAAGDVVLLDLWARRTPDTVWADQTWMGYAGATPPDEVLHVFEAVVAARDAAVQRARDAMAAGDKLTGASLDVAARDVLAQRGYGRYFTHRTGHSIDLDLHGSGPHIDDFETHDIRELLPGVAFSIEPGVYIPGRFGVRSEINVILGSDGPEVTPREPQSALIVG
ncbi:MAG: M24 family metallopeptidase [Gemmatimonadales bacterium]|nr:M24 family metallopeptidase [Gemmatimonadales bacterium]